MQFINFTKNTNVKLVTKYHIKAVHEKQKIHQCEYCGKCFGIKTNLNQHVNRVHEGRKDYKCDHCGNYYYRRVNSTY